jgi:hypothetical protein
MSSVQFRYYLIVFLYKDHFVANEKSEKELVKLWYSPAVSGILWCSPTISGELWSLLPERSYSNPIPRRIPTSVTHQLINIANNATYQ